MARTHPLCIKLKTHKASGRLYKCVGRALGRDGRPKPKVFYFDPAAPEVAVSRVIALRAEWKRLRAEGKSVWDESPAYLRQQGKTLADADPAATKIITVADAKQQYLDYLRRQWEGGQCSKKHYTSQRERLNNAAKPLEMLPLSVVDRQQLEAAVLRLCGRPMVRFPGREPHRMSATYAKASISSMKWCFDWLAEEGHWTRCRQWSRLWKKEVVLTDQERQQHLDGTGADTAFFTVDELAKVWSTASHHQRALILCGLNMAFSNAECSSLTVHEVKGLETDAPYVERYRRKTVKRAGKGAYGKWFLWPETAEYLRKCKAPANDQNLWFLTGDGNALNENGSIIQGWRRLVQRAEVRPLGFRFLRKTAAHLLRNSLGHGAEVTDMLLAHADLAMLRAYAGRDWDGRLREATTQLRVHLASVWAEPADTGDAVA